MPRGEWNPTWEQDAEAAVANALDEGGAFSLDWLRRDVRAYLDDSVPEGSLPAADAGDDYTARWKQWFEQRPHLRPYWQVFHIDKGRTGDPRYWEVELPYALTQARPS